MSLAVIPANSGAGLGRQLVGAFSDELHSLGTSGYSLTTDADDNEPVNHFYRALGFTLTTQWTRSDGRRMNGYELNFPCSQPRSKL
jgi:GNAT superfamily N-acetyltransferase